MKRSCKILLKKEKMYKDVPSDRIKKLKYSDESSTGKKNRKNT